MQRNRSQSGNERVFLTGLGPICPLGIGVGSLATAFWEVSEGIPGEEGEEPSGPLAAPQVDLSEFIETTRPYVDRHSEFALAAGAMALGWAGAEETGLQPERSGLATGTCFGNASSLETFQQVIRAKGMRLASPVLFPHCYANTSNSLLCIEFGLRGYNQNFCGDVLCSARAIQAGHRAVRIGRADLMLAGGVDALSERLGDVLTESGCAPTDLPPGEGGCLLTLENEESMERRGSQAISELAAVVSRGTGVSGAAVDEEAEQRLAGAISSAISTALEEAGMWEGDLGAVFLPVPAEGDDPVGRAGKRALSDFSQLPTFSPMPALGHTFAAAFPLQCTCAALVLSQGALPSPPRLEEVSKGVELWVEQMPHGLLGDAVLVLGWTPRHVIAAILRAV